MTPSEKTLIQSLVAVAWADGQIKEPEAGVIDALLWAFDANDDESTELREYAKKKRTFKDDLPLGAMEAEDKRLLLAHAALLTHADGKQTGAEKKLLVELTKLLGFTEEEAKPILATAKDRAKKLAQKI